MAIMKTIKIPLTGTLGVGTGASLGTLAAEWTSRSTGQTAWSACAVKGGVKFLLGIIFYGVSTKIESPLTSFFLEMMSYGTWGSWFFDVALAAYPGGIPGLAEDWATTTRVFAAGGKKIVRELGTIERKTAGVTEKASAVF